MKTPRIAREVSASRFKGGVSFKIVERSPRSNQLLTSTTTSNVWASPKELTAMFAMIGYVKKPKAA